MHYLRNGMASNASARMFRIFLIYLLVLGVFDILDVWVLSSPDTSGTLRLAICSLYMCLEMATPPLLMFFLPLTIASITERESKQLRLGLIPAAACIAAILFVNPTTGIFFSIDPETNLYTNGNLSYLFVICNSFYLVMAAGIVVLNRARVDAYKTLSLWLIFIIALVGIFAQPAMWDTRLTVFCYTSIILEMYLSYQIPERRTDPLTGMYNRDTFAKQTRRMLARNADVDFAMVYTNIVEFKAINELYGTETGDSILVRLAHDIMENVGTAGTAGRLQGDHFAFCLPREQFSIDDLLEKTSGEVFQDAYGCDINIVFGICESTGLQAPPNVLCDRARLALRDLEWSRNHRFAYYDDERGEKFLKSHELSSQMNAALADGQFEVYLQPIYRLTDERLAGAEALVRWNHPAKGLISPGDFIPVFERTGQIAELDEFVWETVCSKLSRWDTARLDHFSVSMNVSRADLRPGLNAAIAELFERFHVDARLARFEITESAYIEHVDQLKEFIDALHDCGFTVMLDDFGSGYSSLSVLENAPFDEIKIDREFIADVMDDERSRTVLEAIIQLAGKLNLPVITEGIETKEQADLLRQLGSEFAQGYYFARPMPISEFERTVLEPALASAR